MLLLYVLLLAIVVYYLALVGITHIKFSQRKIRASVPLLLVIPLFILFTHARLAFKNRFDKEKTKQIIKFATVEYNLAVVVLIEVMIFCTESARNTSSSIKPVRVSTRGPAMQSVTNLKMDRSKINQVFRTRKPAF